MSLETALKRMCKPAVFGRARRMAVEGEMLHRRSCRYDGTDTVLDARIDATGSWDGPHRPQVVIDEHSESIQYFECDCDVFRGTNKPCKHAAALVLDFCRRPESYEGYDAAGHVRTSRELMRIIERAARTEVPAVGAITETHPGSVTIEPTLVYEAGFSVRFKLVGEHGGYVLKSISDFVGAVEASEYVAYGKSLAFVHASDSFDSRSQSLVEFLIRCVRNRRAYAFDRSVGVGPLGTRGAPQREMHLSSVEVQDLIELFEDDELALEDRGVPAEGSGARRLHVTDGDPDLGLDVRDVEGGSYELNIMGEVRLVAAGNRVLAWTHTNLYRCSLEFSRNMAPLVDVFNARQKSLVLAPDDVRAFAQVVLPKLERVSRTNVPAALDAMRPEPCELQFYLDRTKEGVFCEPFALYGADKIALLGQEGETPNIVRDVKREAQGRSIIRKFFSLDRQGRLAIACDDEQAMARFVFEGVGELQGVGTVFATDSFDRLKSKSRPQARVEVAVRSNLLDLRVHITGMSPRDFAELLESYRLRKRYHRLRDGTFLPVEQPEIRQMEALGEELGLSSRQLADGGATLPAYRALLADTLVDPSWRDASLDDYLARIGTADPDAYELPQSLEGVLRPYQRRGFGWMSALVDQGLAGILADEMGLGKSLQLISVLLARRCEAGAVGPSLIVCPASLVYNWEQELRKFAPGLSVLVVAGSASERGKLRLQRCDVLVTSYDLLRRDIGDYAAMHLWLVALDEAQYIKNHATQAARAAKLLHCEHRFALTGTPIENRLSELWSIFDFLMPGFLGSHEDFCNKFERPIADAGDPEQAERLSRAVSPFILRRLKRDVLSDLPDKLEQVVYVRMGNEQRTLYDAQVSELKERLQNNDDESGRERMQVLAALTRLRQTCCDPRLVFEDYKGPSCKVDTILTLVERVTDAGERLLLFSQFTSFLDIISKELEERAVSHFMLTGSTPKRRRMEMVDEFNSGNTQAFLISLKAGGTGLNLVGASVVIHADPWWNAAAQDQATDRAHRIGQTREVTVYKVICANTLEERIQGMQRRKSDLATSVVGSSSMGSLASLSPSELVELLG